MDLTYNLAHEHRISLRHEIALKIGYVLDTAISVEETLDLALEKALDEGVLQRVADGNRCPNCGTAFQGDFCPGCQQDLDDPKLLDHDPEQEDRETEDLSDSEDADDPMETTEEPDEKFFTLEKPVSRDMCLEGYLTDVGVSEGKIPFFLFLIKLLATTDTSMPEKLPKAILKNAEKAFSLKADKVMEIWNERPFDNEELTEVLEECFAENQADEPAWNDDSPLLEIRKVGGGYVPLVTDPHEDLVINSAAKGQWISLGSSGQRFSGKLVLKRKEQQKAILYKILRTLIDSRRDFLDAQSREEALKILRERPFEQREVVERYGIDKGIISRHFNDKTVLTPHGMFVLKELSRQEALEQDDMTVSALQDIVRMAIAQSDQEGKFDSDPKIRDRIAEQSMEISVRYVTKIRLQLGIPNSRERKKGQKTDV